MDPDERREVLEDAGLDPDEFDFLNEIIIKIWVDRKGDGFERFILF